MLRRFGKHRLLPAVVGGILPAVVGGATYFVRKRMERPHFELMLAPRDPKLRTDYPGSWFSSKTLYDFWFFEKKKSIVPLDPLQGNYVIELALINSPGILPWFGRNSSLVKPNATSVFSIVSFPAYLGNGVRLYREDGYKEEQKKKVPDVGNASGWNHMQVPRFRGSFEDEPAPKSDCVAPFMPWGYAILFTMHFEVAPDTCEEDMLKDGLTLGCFTTSNETKHFSVISTCKLEFPEAKAKAKLKEAKAKAEAEAKAKAEAEVQAKALCEAEWFTIMYFLSGAKAETEAKAKAKTKALCESHWFTVMYLPVKFFSIRSPGEVVTKTEMEAADTKM